ncbi:GNAT family N-acetyltransferase [Mangrovimonas cancribranchiae]|uniref:GNAT family N-acetyltransferase n=1 Tax=Mangrovimonas cancribranchiae TaxID=3080055 RepID=A0AAU6P435_9FLAO
MINKTDFPISNIDTIKRCEFKVVVDVWEASVRATHHFLKEEDIEYFKPLILNTYLDAVELRCIRTTDNKIAGFMGVVENNLEMLFVHPNYIGKGIGKALIMYTVENMKVSRVDVNQQNEEAIGFYKNYGFYVIGRSEFDASGKPYPILHMALKIKNYPQQRI